MSGFGNATGKMTHLNGNLLCAIDIETSGLVCGVHEILEICVLPLDHDLEPIMKPLPFHQMLRPENVDAIDMEAIRIYKQPDNNLDYSHLVTSKEKVAKCVTQGMDKHTAADKFVDWFHKLNLAPFKRIMALGHNLCGIDIPFIKEWLGNETWELCFSPLVRDTMVCSLFLNDIAEAQLDPKLPFAKNNLSYLCSQLGVERLRSHTAFDDAVATSQCYKRMIRATRV